jgi:hypothetical protein
MLLKAELLQNVITYGNAQSGAIAEKIYDLVRFLFLIDQCWLVSNDFCLDQFALIDVQQRKREKFS